MDGGGPNDDVEQLPLLPILKIDSRSHGIIPQLLLRCRFIERNEAARISCRSGGARSGWFVLAIEANAATS
jgi:hypothetical protein